MLIKVWMKSIGVLLMVSLLGGCFPKQLQNDRPKINPVPVEPVVIPNGVPMTPEEMKRFLGHQERILANYLALVNPMVYEAATLFDHIYRQKIMSQTMDELKQPDLTVLNVPALGNFHLADYAWMIYDFMIKRHSSPLFQDETDTPLTIEANSIREKHEVLALTWLFKSAFLQHQDAINRLLNLAEQEQKQQYVVQLKDRYFLPDLALWQQAQVLSKTVDANSLYDDMAAFVELYSGKNLNFMMIYWADLSAIGDRKTMTDETVIQHQSKKISAYFSAAERTLYDKMTTMRVDRIKVEGLRHLFQWKREGSDNATVYLTKFARFEGGVVDKLCGNDFKSLCVID